MKTAISVPDQTFSEVEKRVAVLGVSRSEFYTVAAQRYLEYLESASLTDQIDAAVSLIGNRDESSQAAVVAGHRRLAHIEDIW